MTTEKLYYENCRLAVFSARVLACRQREGGFAVLLDRTAFYPGGGGQACDTGTLGSSRVTGMAEIDEISSLHGLSVLHVETWYNSLCQSVILCP